MDMQNTLNPELQALLNETRILLKTIDVKRGQVSEGTEQALKKLKLLLKELEQENVLLQSLPGKIATKVQEIIPNIAIELNRLNQNEVANLKTALDNSIKEQNKAVNDAAVRLKQTKNELEKIDNGRIKKYILGFSIVLIVSVLSSLGATYAMIKSFPQRIQIESPGNVTVQGSEVSLWSAKNVNVAGNLKNKHR